MTRQNLFAAIVIGLFLTALACGSGGSRPAASGESGSQQTGRRLTRRPVLSPIGDKSIKLFTS